MTPPPEAAYWLALIYDSDLKLSRLKPVIQHLRRSGNRSAAVLFGMPASELQARFGLTAGEAESILAAQSKVAAQAQQLARWQAEGLQVLTLTDADYPARFLYSLPPEQQPLLLWAVGPAALLNEPAVTILGQSDPGEEMSRQLQELAAALAAENVHVVSGFGRGLERAAVETMLATDAGRAILVLPMGLSAFAALRVAPQLVQQAQAGRALLLSPFPPATAFQEKLAAARNLLVDHLALALLVPLADEDAHARALAALNRGASVFVGLTDSPGNRTLVDAGALLMTDSGEVIEFVEQAMIDAALQTVDSAPGPEEAEPGAPPPPAPAGEDDFGLSLPDAEPLPGEEALKILSAGGRVPDALKRRLSQQPPDSQE